MNRTQVHGIPLHSMMVLFVLVLLPPTKFLLLLLLLYVFYWRHNFFTIFNEWEFAWMYVCLIFSDIYTQICRYVNVFELWKIVIGVAIVGCEVFLFLELILESGNSSLKNSPLRNFVANLPTNIGYYRNFKHLNFIDFFGNLENVFQTSTAGLLKMQIIFYKIYIDSLECPWRVLPKKCYINSRKLLTNCFKCILI